MRMRFWKPIFPAVCGALLWTMPLRAGVAHHHRAPSPNLQERLRQKVRYVFVIYQENRSFDSYFGTFPGAEGIFSHPASETPGFYQPLLNTDGTTGTVHPFRIGPGQYAADTDDVDHSHPAIVAKEDIQHGLPQMDRFAMVEERRVSPIGHPSLAARQFGELTMAYEDCDTIPLLWRYASRFALYDHIFQLVTGPSTLGNLAIIGAQTGVTQWVLHPDEAYKGNGAHGPGEPVVNDNDPFWGSQKDPAPAAQKMPVNPHDFHFGREYGTAYNQTWATLPVSTLGGDAKRVTDKDSDSAGDLSDIRKDIQFLTQQQQARVPFGWYQEGYSDKPRAATGADPTDAGGLHASYVTHHNGPQYFGYVANNKELRQELHGLGDFYTAIATHSLPPRGIFFVKGGYRNQMHLSAADPDSRVQQYFRGDDDHPGYSDAQISEALVARTINAIARSPYWNQSAIIVTWDDSEGDYDHVRPPVDVYGPDGSVLSDGPRVPLLLISPYAKTHAIVSSAGNQASVVKFADLLFGLTPLAKLPDEAGARALGKQRYHQDNLGPQDALTPGVSDLLDGFDPARLAGRKAPLPPDYAEIPDALIDKLPQQTGYGCKQLGIVPVDRRLGIRNEIPKDFNPRPKTQPTEGKWL